MYMAMKVLLVYPSYIKLWRLAVLFLKSSLPLGSPSPGKCYSYICQQGLVWALSLSLSPSSPVAMHHRGIPGEARGPAHLPRSLKHLLVVSTKLKRPVMNLNVYARKSPGSPCCGKIWRYPSSSLLWTGGTQAKRGGLLLTDLPLSSTSLLYRSYGVDPWSNFIQYGWEVT